MSSPPSTTPAYTSPALAPALDQAASCGKLVTQSDRLGDSAINSSSTTARHNAVNRCFYTAVAAVATTRVLLGDKGNGSPAARREALTRYAHLNAT